MDDIWGTEEDLYYVDPDYEVYSQIAVLYGLSPETLTENELILIPGKLSLKKMDSDEINDRLSFQKNLIPWKQINVLDLNEILGRDIYSQFNPLNLGLLSLRLLKPGYVYFGPIITYTEDKSTASITNFEKRPNPSTFFNMMNLDRNEKQELVKIINGIHNLDPENTPYLRIAFSRFSRYFSNRHREDKLIDLCIAFEALFLKGEYKQRIHSMGVLIGKLCSELIGDTKDDKKKISSIIQTCYQLRNKVVHGAAIKEDEITNALPQFENYFRQSIKQIISRIREGQN